jgi:hypothetical protein
MKCCNVPASHTCTCTLVQKAHVQKFTFRLHAPDASSTREKAITREPSTNVRIHTQAMPTKAMPTQTTAKVTRSI